MKSEAEKRYINFMVGAAVLTISLLSLSMGFLISGNFFLDDSEDLIAIIQSYENNPNGNWYSIKLNDIFAHQLSSGLEADSYVSQYTVWD